MVKRRIAEEDTQAGAQALGPEAPDEIEADSVDVVDGEGMEVEPDFQGGRELAGGTGRVASSGRGSPRPPPPRSSPPAWKWPTIPSACTSRRSGGSNCSSPTT